MSADVRIGVDLGGTKIEAIALDAAGVEVFRQRVATPKGDYDATIDAVRQLVDVADAAAGARGHVGIGMPGAISPATGLVKNANSTWLIGRPLREDLARALGRPVRLENDANCFALSEATDGAGAGHDVVFGVILGTGTGGGIVVHGRPIVGANAIAGEWGHNPLPWPTAADLPGPDCYCGQRGCIETFLSGAGLVDAHHDVGGTGDDAHVIAEAAAGGDRRAVDAVERYATRLARALAGVINILDPNVIVVGGGLSNIDVLYTRVPAQGGEWVFSDRVDTTLVPARHGDSSGVRGAAWLWEK